MTFYDALSYVNRARDKAFSLDTRPSGSNEEIAKAMAISANAIAEMETARALNRIADAMETRNEREDK